MPLADWELWACAQHVITGFGEDALDHVDERIHDLMLKGDEEGIGTCIAIADRIKALSAEPGDGDTRH